MRCRTRCLIPPANGRWNALEALAHEVAKFGVRVVNMEPGVIMTNIFEMPPMTRYDKTSPTTTSCVATGRCFSLDSGRRFQKTRRSTLAAALTLFPPVSLVLDITDVLRQRLAFDVGNPGVNCGIAGHQQQKRPFVPGSSQNLIQESHRARCVRQTDQSCVM